MQTPKRTPEIQLGANGRELRLSGVRLDLTKPPKYLNGMYCHYYWITYIYLDNNSFFGYYFEPNDNVLHKLTHDEVLKLC
jgi:hypothetical protein